MSYGPVNIPLGQRRARSAVYRQPPDFAFGAVTTCLLGAATVGLLSALLTGGPVGRC